MQNLLSKFSKSLLKMRSYLATALSTVYQIIFELNLSLKPVKFQHAFPLRNYSTFSAFFFQFPACWHENLKLCKIPSYL